MEYTSKDFAALFGIAESELPVTCLEFAGRHDFHYEIADAAAHDQIILRVLKHIGSDSPTPVGPQREGLWDRCWAENLQKFIGSGYELEALVPKFIKPDQPVRLRQRYVLPRSLAFELAFFSVCRAYYFRKFLSEVRTAYEFGCGTGFNLVALGQQLPRITLHGLDWSPSACEMVNSIGKKHELDIAATRFDFFNPDRSLALDPHGAVITISALEQVGSRHEAFLDFLMEKKPAICLHMEPIEELYDENNLIDYLALMYHRKRGYLSGFLPRLKSLEAEKKAEILEVRRMYFGSLYQEGYSFVVWRPV